MTIELTNKRLGLYLEVSHTHKPQLPRHVDSETATHQCFNRTGHLAPRSYFLHLQPADFDSNTGEESELVGCDRLRISIVDVMLISRRRPRRSNSLVGCPAHDLTSCMSIMSSHHLSLQAPYFAALSRWMEVLARRRRQGS